MTLWESVMRKNAPITRNVKEFYGNFAQLNSPIYDPPEQEAIKQFQLWRLEQFQLRSIKNSNKAREVNQFLLTKGRFNSDVDPQKTIEQSIKKIYDNLIVNVRTSGALSKAGRADPNKVAAADAALKGIGEEIAKIESMLDNRAISGVYVDKLKAYINKSQYVNGGVSADEMLKNFWSLQGEILEEVGTEWFNTKIPHNMNIQAVSTGRVNLSGKGQLPMDILAMDMSDTDLLNKVMVSYTLNGKSENRSLNEFLNVVRANRDNHQIVLQQTELDKVMAHAVAGIQAKSGKNQLPWNKESKNTQVKIGDMDKGEYPVYAMNRLHDLLLTPHWDAAKNMLIISPAYQAMANYGLGTMINRILHLSDAENQYVLTPKGFMTYTERMNQLIKNNGYYFYSSQVKFREDVLTTPLKVDIKRK